MWTSLYAMTVVDLLIIGCTTFAIRFFTRRKHLLLTKRGFYFVIFGMSCFTGIYLIDFLIMWVLPFFISERRVMAYMEDLHLNHAWYFSLLGIGSIVIGLTELIKRLLLFSKRNTALLGAIPDMMFRLSREGVHLDFKTNDPDTLYVSPNKIIGSNISEVMPPEFTEKCMRCVADTLDSNTLQTFEYQLQMPEGLKDFEARFVTSGSNEVLMMVRDITERRQAEETLSKWKNAFQYAGWGVGFSRSDSSFFEIVNPAYANMLGYEIEEMIGMEIFQIFAPEARPQLKVDIQSAHQKGHHRFESKLIRKDGTIFPALIDLAAVKDDQGKVLHRISNVQDITERKQAETALQKSEEHYRLLTELSPNAILVHRDGKFVFVNQAGLRLFRATNPEQLIGKPIIGFAHKDYLHLIAERIEKVKDGRSVAPFIEEKLIRLDGTEVDVLVAGQPFTYQGKPAIQVVIQDISEHKQAEQERRESEEKWRSLTEHSPDHIRLLDRDGVIQFINRTIFLPREEVIGKTIYSLMPPEFQKIASDCIEGVFRTGKANSYENEYTSPDGKTQYFDTLVGPLFDGGEVVKVICSSRNITERKKIDDRLKSILNALPDIIFIIDEEGRHLEILTSQQTLLFDQLETIKGSLLEETLPLEVADFLLEKIRETIKTGTGQIFEYKLEVQQGKTWFEGRTSPLQQKFEGKQAVVLLSINVTDRKNLEEQLLQAQKMESMGILAGGIAHEFNNLLSPILGHTSMLLDKQTEESLETSSLEQIYQAGERAKTLVQQILAFSRKSMLEQKSVQLEVIVKEALKFLAQTIPATVSIQQEIEPDLPSIIASPHEIHQVIVNLCLNANHAMPEGGTLRIRLNNSGLRELVNLQGKTVDGPFICLSIQDTGSGIDEAILDHIFDPFYTTKAVGEGTGLGLSVVLGIVEQHQGIIEVESQVGEGSTFHIYFPTSSKKEEPFSESQEHPTLTGDESILLVDDDPGVQKASSALLEDLGYQMASFTDSQEALRAFEKQPDHFDLVITDYTMPHMTGKQLAAKLREIRPDIPIILTTGYNEAVTNESIRAWGIDEWLMKPSPRKEMSAMIRKVLDRYKN